MPLTLANTEPSRKSFAYCRLLDCRYYVGGICGHYGSLDSSDGEKGVEVGIERYRAARIVRRTWWEELGPLRCWAVQPRGSDRTEIEGE